jgi:hypothetical protein
LESKKSIQFDTLALLFSVYVVGFLEWPGACQYYPAKTKFKHIPVVWMEVQFSLSYPEATVVWNGVLLAGYLPITGVLEKEAPMTFAELMSTYWKTVYLARAVAMEVST